MTRYRHTFAVVSLYVRACVCVSLRLPIAFNCQQLIGQLSNADIVQLLTSRFVADELQLVSEIRVHFYNALCFALAPCKIKLCSIFELFCFFFFGLFLKSVRLLIIPRIVRLTNWLRMQIGRPNTNCARNI